MSVDFVSVVIASNRLDSYLDAAIQSVLASDGVSVEVILVLDGIELSEPTPKWAADSRIRIITREHSGGPAAAANDGIRVAKSDYIARLDSDDLVSKSRLRKQLDALNSANRPILVGAKTLLIDESGAPIGSPVQTCGDDVRRELLLQNVVPHSTFMFRKSDALEIGLYKSELRQMEDYDFLLRLAMRGPISVVCDQLVQYRVHVGQTSRKAHWRADYISAVTSGRVNLGKLLRVPTVEVHAKNLIWRLVQVFRSTGLLKPRYLIGVQKTKTELAEPN